MNAEEPTPTRYLKALKSVSQTSVAVVPLGVGLTVVSGFIFTFVYRPAVERIEALEKNVVGVEHFRAAIDRIDRVESDVRAGDERAIRLEVEAKHYVASLHLMSEAIQRLDEKIDNGFDKLNAKIDTIRSKP